MCGIAGSFVFKNSSFTVTAPYLTRMRDVMQLRGPDGSGNWISSDGKIGLAHRRLSIIDLSEAATQPMSNEDGSLWIVFNGEIYNHADIRKELKQIGGHQWKTDHSDTEVILHAFEQWGIECVHRFRGIFAFSLWNAKTRELWLIRDRIGVKPLYYSLHHGRINFASEIKALLQDSDQPRQIHEEAFFHYLSFLCSPAPQTLFEGIKKVPAASWIKVREDGHIKEHRYWDVWDQAPMLEGASDGELAQQILSEMRTSVRLRKVSDVPVGVFLSGGIDSSTNAVLFAEGETNPVRTFSIGYDADYGSYRSELPYARKVAAQINAEHHELLLSQDDLLNFLPQMVYLQDEPIADPVCVPVYYVAKLAREHGVTVCQVGEGADELFWGYPGWKMLLRLQQMHDWGMPAWTERLGMAGLRRIGRGEGGYGEWLRRLSEGYPVFWGGTEALSHTRKMCVLSERLRRKFAGRSSWEALQPIRARFEERSPDMHPVQWMTYLDLNLRLPELLLMRVDKMTMGVSLEGREPFLDHKLVELAMSIPGSAKTRHGVLKYLLKKSVRGLIPDEIINRKKQGFGVPVHEWFMERLGDYARQELTGFCRETDFFDPAEVTRILDERKGGLAWILLNFALWWKQWVRS